DAGLAALVVGEGGDALRGPVQVRLGGPVGQDDGRAVAAELQGAVLARHRVEDVVADLLGAGEGDDGQPLVLDEGRHRLVAHRAADVVEGGGPHMGGGRGELVLDGDGGGDGLLDLGLGGDAHRADETSVPGGGDVEGGVAGGLAAGEPEGGGGCRVRHSNPGP